nr:hypothetical protein MtrunA17_Chr4g0073721 [Ipomoea batatas]
MFDEASIKAILGGFVELLQKKNHRSIICLLVVDNVCLPQKFDVVGIGCNIGEEDCEASGLFPPQPAFSPPEPARPLALTDRAPPLLLSDDLVLNSSHRGPLVLSTKGSILTHNNEKMEAKRTDHMTTMVGVLFCRPMSPLRNGYRWTMTQKAKNSFPNSGPHDWDPLLMASEIPATTPTKLMIRMVVGGISSVVHLKVYSSPNSSSSTALEVTVKFVSIPASTFRRPCTTAKR